MLCPSDHGRKMSLKDFEFVEVQEDRIYELGRGVIVVSEDAEYFHSMQIVAIRQALIATCKTSESYLILGPMDCKLLIPEMKSERHPDIAVYLTKPKGMKGRTLWRNWLPELTIEVITDDSRDRDCIDKREEYWTLGIQEYWIVDAKLDQVVILKRGKSDWIDKTLGPDGVIETKRLPGFKLACQTVLEAGKEQDDAND